MKAARYVLSNLYAHKPKLPPRRQAMADLISIGAALAFFALALAYVTACEHL